MFVIVVLYTVFGGFISVVHTDAVQGALMLLGSAYLLFSVLRAGGGWTSIADIRTLILSLVTLKTM